MIAQASLLDLLEHRVKANDRTGVNDVVNQSHHCDSVILDLSIRIHVLELGCLEHQVVPSGWREPILDDLHDHSPVDPRVELGLVRRTVGRIEISHSERWIGNRCSSSQRCTVSGDCRTLTMLHLDLLILRQKICRRLDCAVNIPFDWNSPNSVAH